MRPLKVLQLRLPPAIRRRTDAAATLLLFALTVVATWDLLRGEVIVGSDPATQYYPWYSFLGESLWSGHIPAWNPHQFSGTPFAADPLSGWTYLPAMLLFTFLPLAAAAKSYLFFHLLLAGLSTYALARSLGIKTTGALLAAIAYEYSGFLYLLNTCCFPYPAVMAWLPLALLGVERAVRASGRLERVVWWGVTGLGLSQILASWLGQGSYYALLALGGYVIYRTLLSPPGIPVGLTQRLGGPFSGILKNPRKAILGTGTRLLRCVLHGGATLVFGFGLAAAGVLPRLEYNALSNLAGGYPGLGGREAGGWSLEDWRFLLDLLEPSYLYAGVTVLALAPLALLVARRRFAVPYFATLMLCTLILSGQGTTPLHSALYLLPYMERLHPHDPDRVMVLFYLGAALLAGAALTSLEERAGKKPLWLVPPALTALLLAAASLLVPLIEAPAEKARAGGWEGLSSLVSKNGISSLSGPLLALILAVVLIAAYVRPPARFAAWLAPALLILVVFADLLVTDKATAAEYPTGVGTRMDLTSYYRPSGAARFLQSKGGEPFRYLGYDPGLEESSHVSSNMRFADLSTQALEANSRAVLLGLQDIQGYNPTHLARYGAYMRALNGFEQNYHFTDVYQEGLYSPLLDLLNARYIIVPTHPSQENPAGPQQFEQFERTHPTVYEDDQTKVLENQQALPRAWIVHSAQQVLSDDDALNLLDSGHFNPKETALLTQEPSQKLSQPDNPSDDQVSVTEYAADRIQLRTSTPAPGLLVMSEVYYPAWKAYVDGEAVPVQAADQLLRSVAVPAGEHVVEFRYESWTLRVGIALSLLTGAALIALAVVAGIRRWRGTRGAVGKAKSW